MHPQQPSRLSLETDMEPNLKKLREQLVATMAQTGMTQTDVATHTQVSQSVISRFLRGKGMNAVSARKLLSFVGEEVEGVAPLAHEDIRKAVKLYRFVQEALEKGDTLILRDKDGVEKHVAFLW